MIPSFQNVRHGLTEHHIQCHTLAIIFFYASLLMTIKLTLTSDKNTFRYKSNGTKFISYNLQIYKLINGQRLTRLNLDTRACLT